MALPGPLTRSSWLYEGNYDDWEQRVNAILHFNNHYHDLAKYAKLRKGQRVSGLCCKGPRLERLCSIILSNVSLEFLDRIPEAARSDIRRLTIALKAHARPFQFLKLPAELREMVYILSLIHI